MLAAKVALSDNRPDASLGGLDDGELQRAKGVANSQEYPFTGSTRNKDKPFVLQNQFTQHVEPCAKKLHAAGASQEFIGSGVAMPHPPRCIRFPQ